MLVEEREDSAGERGDGGRVDERDPTGECRECLVLPLSEVGVKPPASTGGRGEAELVEMERSGLPCLALRLDAYPRSGVDAGPPCGVCSSVINIASSSLPVINRASSSLPSSREREEEWEDSLPHEWGDSLPHLNVLIEAWGEPPLELEGLCGCH